MYVYIVHDKEGVKIYTSVTCTCTCCMCMHVCMVSMCFNPIASYTCRFDLNIEPIFAVMALYDAKEKKKISESFHLDCNPGDITHMLDDHVDERSMPSLSRSAIFNISYPNADVFLIVKVHVHNCVCFHSFKFTAHF